jgi:hypothetical protein
MRGATYSERRAAEERRLELGGNAEGFARRAMAGPRETRDNHGDERYVGLTESTRDLYEVS